MSIHRFTPIAPTRSHLVFALALATMVGVPAASAQTVRYEIDPRASLAWWEINPNMSHLWATTCPQDPGWQPGEGRSMDAMVDYVRRNSSHVFRMSDSTKIPLYPRKVVRSLCTPALKGAFTVADTVNWRGIKGEVVIDPKLLVTGLDYRDEYARKAIYGTDSYAEIRYQIDSLTPVRKTAGDTLRAEAVGFFEFRGVRTPMHIPVRITRSGNGLRVEGQTHVPAAYLTETYGISKMALGMSVGLRIWKDLHMGIDAVIRPATGTS
jgi:polyisoprenoid-binding protein YceI